MSKWNGLIICNPDTLELVYPTDVRQILEQYVNWVAPPMTRTEVASHPAVLGQVEALFCGWSLPDFDDPFLDQTPSLRAIFSATGVPPMDAIRRRGITLTTAHEANSRPVAEYTFASIIFALKHAWHLARGIRERRTLGPRHGMPGCFRSTVGLIGMGMIARAVLKWLQALDVEVIAFDPLLKEQDATRLGVKLCSLDEVFSASNVVSVHVPLLPSTKGLITGRHLQQMKAGASFINTARGAIVVEQDLIAVARQRPDLQFVIDVTEPEPAAPESPLYDLPNVVLTPHIAGSTGGECRRLGLCMAEELKRLATGQPLQHAACVGSAIQIPRPGAP